MGRWGRVGLVAGILVLTASAGRAQVGSIPNAPPRDRVPPPVTGTGSIAGRVVDGATGAPLGRVRVRLQGGGAQRPSVTTDASGRFAFKDLPAASFAMMAEKSTYLMARYPEGGNTFRSQMKMLTLANGEAASDITLRLFRGSAITGRVVDGAGDPVEYAEVRVLRVSGGKPIVRGGSNTNDIGEFRIARLEPGTYLLMAIGRRGSPDDLLPGVTPPPISLPTYYPGALGLDQAQPITIERGQTVSDLEIQLAEGIPAVVSGTVVDESGEPLRGSGFVTARAAVRDGTMLTDVAGSGVRADGTFRLALPPGEYVLQAQGVVRPPNQPLPGSGGVGGIVIGLPPSGQPSERFGSARVSAVGTVDGVIITLGPGATATGRIVFDGTSPPPPVPAGGQFRLPLSSSDGPGCRQGPTTVAPDWTFRVEGLSGTCSAPGQMGFGNWILKSVTIGDRDLLSEQVTFETGQRLRNVVVTFTDRRGALSFNVSDDSGQSTTEYVALAWPVAAAGTPFPSVRTFVPPPPRPSSPRSAPGMLTIARPGTTLGGLAAGEYYVIAVDDIGIEEVRDPGVIARLAGAAQRVTVGDTPQTTVPLKRQALADLVRR